MARAGSSPRSSSRGGRSASNRTAQSNKRSSRASSSLFGAPERSGRSSSSGRGGSGSGRVVSRGSSRAFVVVALFMALAVLLTGRLVYWQVFMHDQLSEAALDQRLQQKPIIPRRGTIYDRNGNILAMSVDAVNVTADPTLVTQKAKLAAVLADSLGGKATDYLELLSSNGRYAKLSMQADVDKVNRLKEQLAEEDKAIAAQFSARGESAKTEDYLSCGLYFEDTQRREYPYGKTGGQVIGMCNYEEDEETRTFRLYGFSGLESYYDRVLAGTEGYYEAELGRDGTPIPGGVQNYKAPVEGQDIVISLDIEFQEEVEAALEAGLVRVGTKSGNAVVMDSTTGELFAAASCPLFNPADRSKIEAGAEQLKSVSYLFEPGSAFKSVTAMAALENNYMTPDDELTLPPYLEADGYIVSDAYDRGEVTWPLRTIIAMSSNVGVSLTAEGMGFDKLYDAILQYNFDKLTGVDYPGEQLGYVLDFDDWSRVVGYNVSFGQGISVNSLQLTRFYGALANDGIEVTPHFLVRKPMTNEVPTYSSEQVVKNKAAIPQMIEMLRGVVTSGTGTAADIDGYEVVGKTSTAEIYDEENGGYRVGVYDLAFAGFIADSNSPLVCFVGANEVPGDRAVTSIFQDIMTHAISRYNIVPE